MNKAANPTDSSNSPDQTRSSAAINARSFGAKGDGRTDDTAAIQKALDAAAANHDSVFLPAGTYLCSTHSLRPQTGLFGNPRSPTAPTAALS